MNFLNSILTVLNPAFASVAGGQWGEIKNKLVKSVAYFFISVFFILILFQADLPIENMVNVWLIIFSFATFSFSGLLLISGLIDLLQRNFSFLGRKGAFFVLMVIFIGVVLGVVSVLWGL